MTTHIITTIDCGHSKADRDEYWECSICHNDKDKRIDALIKEVAALKTHCQTLVLALEARQDKIDHLKNLMATTLLLQAKPQVEDMMIQKTPAEFIQEMAAQIIAENNDLLQRLADGYKL